jgi:RNA polymerase sigma factor (sigma-70 family)
LQLDVPGPERFGLASIQLKMARGNVQRFFVRIFLPLRNEDMNEQNKTSQAGERPSSAGIGFTPETALDYDRAVEEFYQPLYKFAFGLAGNESDAADLTQETYQVLLTKGGQIRDGGKLKSWLFTTLYRKFLMQHRHQTRFPEVQVESADWELPTVDPKVNDHLDAQAVLAALHGLEEKYRAPLVLHYLEEHSYREIATILGVPVGTIMSRLSRGKEILRQRLEGSSLNGFIRQYGRPSQTNDGSVSARASAARQTIRQWPFGAMASCH